MGDITVIGEGVIEDFMGGILNDEMNHF